MNDLALHTALHRDADLVGEPSPDLLDQLVRRRQHQRRQRAGILAVAAAVVVVGGGIPVVSSLTMGTDVAPATQPTIPSTPPAPTEAAPTTSAAPAPSSSPVPATAPAPDPEPAALVLGPDGLGALEIGMTIGAAEATGMLEPREVTWPAGTGCSPRFRLAGDSTGTSGVWYDDAFGIAAIHVAAGVQTPEGIGIGSPLSAVEQAYPGWDHSYQVLRGVAPVTGRPELAYRIGFSQDGVVTELALQRYMNGCYE